ncbi:MAG: TerC family protein [Alphaproteobacteria bacterium]|nr:TerC family protein [Alphaproteobacteria bacterium]
MEWMTDPHIWIGFFTLTFLEIVLGIDNLLFLSVVTGRLPEEQQPKARAIGLGLALVLRIALLIGVVWVIGLTKPIFELYGHVVSWRDLILLAGGLFLLQKGTQEIHATVEGEEDAIGPIKANFYVVIGQVAVLDLVFSFDSILTAIGLTPHLPVIIAAVVIAIGVMLLLAEKVSEFVKRFPTVKMLAMSFLLLIGMALVADGMHFEIPKGYLYFAVAFSLFVEVLNQLAAHRRRQRLAKTKS